MAYLVDHPPKIRQFRDRGTTPSGVVVVHTAESVPDTIGPDAGAEGVAAFIASRTTYGSYHDLADSDSIVNLVPYRMQAYGDGTGSNPHAYHVSAATQAHRWNTLPKGWREDTVRNMARAAARYAAWIERTHGVKIPARRITRAESDRRVPGFLGHGERDPGRRTDPGASFPWDLFLEAFEELTNPKPVPKPTRGKAVNAALRHTAAAILAIEDAHGGKNRTRTRLIEAAEVELREARRALRRIAILNLDEIEEAKK